MKIIYIIFLGEQLISLSSFLKNLPCLTKVHRINLVLLMWIVSTFGFLQFGSNLVGAVLFCFHLFVCTLSSSKTGKIKFLGEYLPLPGKWFFLFLYAQVQSVFLCPYKFQLIPNPSMSLHVKQCCYALNFLCTLSEILYGIFHFQSHTIVHVTWRTHYLYVFHFPLSNRIISSVKFMCKFLTVSNIAASCLLFT